MARPVLRGVESGNALRLPEYTRNFPDAEQREAFLRSPVGEELNQLLLGVIKRKGLYPRAGGTDCRTLTHYRLLAGLVRGGEESRQLRAQVGICGQELLITRNLAGGDGQRVSEQYVLQGQGIRTGPRRRAGGIKVPQQQFLQPPPLQFGFSGQRPRLLHFREARRQGRAGDASLVARRRG
jgi:hypothetical protein